MGRTPPISWPGAGSWVVGYFSICSQTKVSRPASRNTDGHKSFLITTWERQQLSHRLAVQGLHLRVKSAGLLLEAWVDVTLIGA